MYKNSSLVLNKCLVITKKVALANWIFNDFTELFLYVFFSWKSGIVAMIF